MKPKPKSLESYKAVRNTLIRMYGATSTVSKPTIRRELGNLAMHDLKLVARLVKRIYLQHKKTLKELEAKK